MWSVLKIKQTFMSLWLMQDGSVPLSLPLLKCDMLEFDAKVSISLKSHKYLFQFRYIPIYFGFDQYKKEAICYYDSKGIIEHITLFQLCGFTWHLNICWGMAKLWISVNDITWTSVEALIFHYRKMSQVLLFVCQIG